MRPTLLHSSKTRRYDGGRPAGAGSDRHHWKLQLMEGIILVLLGFVAAFVPFGLGIAIFGWLFLIGGMTGLITTIVMWHAAGFWWSLLSAVFALCTDRSGSVSQAAILGRGARAPSFARSAIAKKGSAPAAAGESVCWRGSARPSRARVGHRRRAAADDRARRCEACRSKKACRDWLDYAPAMVNFAPCFCMNAYILFELQCDQPGPRRVN